MHHARLALTWPRACALGLALAFASPGAGAFARSAQDEPPVGAQTSSPRLTREAFLTDLEKRLARHPFFRKITYKAVDRGGLHFLVQRPQRDLPDYESRLAERYGPWLEAIERAFVRDYVEPQGLEPNGALPVFTLTFLSSRGDYDNYAQATRSEDLNSAQAHYDPELRLAVTYEDPFVFHPEHLQRRPVLHEFVHVLQHAYSTYEKDLPAAPWFNEGLAQYLAFHLGRTPESLAKHELETYAAEQIGALMHREENAPLYFNRTADLVAFKSYADVQRAAFERAKEGGKRFDAARAMQAFYQQSYLLVHFLHHGEQQRYLPSLKRTVAALLAGEPSEKAFAAEFEGVPLDQLDREFRQYVLEAAGIPSVEAAPAASAEPAAFSPDALAPTADEPAESIALAVGLALSGRAQRALEVLAAVSSPAPEVRERVELESARIRGWRELREHYVLDLIESKKPLKLDDFPGGGLSAPVLGIEGDALVLGENKRGLARLALDALEPLDVVQRLGSDAARLGPDWVRLYPLCATDNPKWKRILVRDKSPEVERLRADAESFYPEALRTAEVLLAIDSLRQLGLPTDVEQARAVLAQVELLWPAHAQRPIVARLHDPLRALAQRALELELAASGVAGLVHVPVEAIGEDAVRLRYDFSSAEQAADFRLDPDCHRDERDQLAPLATSNASGSFAAAQGGFSGNGAVAWRFALELEAPLRVTYTVMWRERPGEPVGANTFILGLCDDGFGSSVEVQGLGHLTVLDKNTSHLKQSASAQTSIYLGRSYRFEVVHDGGQVSVLRDGQQVSRAQAGPRTSGGIYLWVQSDLDIVVRDLTIEGRASPAACEATRRGLVARELARLGF